MSDVRAITVRQPWAWAIAHGGKTIENRSRGTSHRGSLLIHAGLAWSDHGATDSRVVAAWQAANPPIAPGILQAHRIPKGAVIAVAELVDAHPDAGCCRPWGESSYADAGGGTRTVVHHLMLEDVVALAEPVECLGALGLWRPQADVVERALGGRS